MVTMSPQSLLAIAADGPGSAAAGADVADGGAADFGLPLASSRWTVRTPACSREVPWTASAEPVNTETHSGLRTSTTSEVMSIGALVTDAGFAAAIAAAKAAAIVARIAKVVCIVDISILMGALATAVAVYARGRIITATHRPRPTHRRL